MRGDTDIWIKLARCCTPVPGDSIFGFITRSGGVSVHRDDCTNADDLRQQPDRMVAVEWKPTAASMFLVAIQVEALDRHKLLADVTRVLSDERVNILSAHGHHDPRPGGGEPVQLRDGRPEAPGAPARRGAQGRRRLRRLPGHLRRLTPTRTGELERGRILTGEFEPRNRTLPSLRPYGCYDADGDGLVVGLGFGFGDGVVVATEVGVTGPAVTLVKVNGWFGWPPPGCPANSPSSPAAAPA